MNTTLVSLRNWVGAFFLGLIAWRIVLGIINSFDDTPAKQALTHIALVNGIIIGAGLSPNIATANAIISATPLLNYQASAFIGSLVDVATVLDLIVGSLTMYDKGRIPALFAFSLAFASGYILPLTPVVGVFTWLTATLVSGFSPNTGF